ncbi:MAG: phosphoglucosamine mutase [Endozoicomonadaceae bacterium]|nr:phosphoglucosamine mutase [Endozoicomonadaceae bacterium]MBE8233172.1 phosphoglucosamine mutase [Endozoicomonadaceae bacterium]
MDNELNSMKVFGTDGIRGRVGEFPITPGFFLQLGLVTGYLFAEMGYRRIIISKDTRISGYIFESALEAGFTSASIDVLLLGPMPTPAVAYLARTFNACGAIVSASHNPYYDNGVKFFTPEGIKLSHMMERKIEQSMNKNLSMVASNQLGKVHRMNDAAGRYIEHCKSTVLPELNLSGIHLVLDAANGANYHVGPDVFRELGATVTLIGAQPNGLNINENCGATYLYPLQKKVKALGADLGIAFDGDGDRVVMIDEKGTILDGDDILFIIAMYRKRHDLLGGGVVGTCMSNLGLEETLVAHNIPFYRAGIGDRYINEALMSKKWLLGGEPSGHIICRHLTTTGDGIVVALQVLFIMMKKNQPLSMLRKSLLKYPQKTVNIPLPSHYGVLEKNNLNIALRQIEKQSQAKERIVIRLSGTEPVIRIMVENSNDQTVTVQLKKIVALIGNLIHESIH